jgi:hypothetical protein
MTSFNADYNNTEMFDSEVSVDELESVAIGGVMMNGLSQILTTHLAAIGECSCPSCLMSKRRSSH